jgi:hypothetical protein
MPEIEIVLLSDEVILSFAQDLENLKDEDFKEGFVRGWKGGYKIGYNYGVKPIYPEVEEFKPFTESYLNGLESGMRVGELKGTTDRWAFDQ